MLAASYMGLKHTHIMLAFFSIIFFNFRFWKYFLVARPKWARIVPHIIDTFLLLTGILLAVALSINPFSLGGSWLGVKLFFIVLYILFAILAMRQSFALSTRLINYLICNSMAMAVVWMAMMKPQLF
ncbi:SirB2 family protein [Ignatzschineria indica]|uniref:SirB2 family protein n=1 Tax=Ignatzschineria indica TaxID=472583 RepID=UPI002576E2C5|nr:SirB2 family protein [Ignatzschineria indica]MDM1546140.1 SirB2 family protein [Ignatzschineria indica]